MRRCIPWLILLFPVSELWVLIQIGKEIGALATVGLVLVSVLVGFALLRLRGMHIAKTIQSELIAGRVPSNQIVDTFCLMIAGWLFIFPGFLSDILAVLLIIPAVRNLMLSLATAKLRNQGFHSQTTHFTATADGSGQTTWTCTTHGTASTETQGSRELRGNAVIIDCEPEVLPPEDAPSDIRRPPG